MAPHVGWARIARSPGKEPAMAQPGNGYTFARARAAVIACVLLLGAGVARADKLRIENVTVAPRDDQTAAVKFDIAWENSWRNKVNHDAAWVFLR
jgi:hypothetical protein